MSRRTVIMLAAGLLLAAPLHAQQRTADLRYAAPQPVRVTYSSIDSMSIVMSGLPIAAGDMTGHLHSVVDLEIREEGGRLAAKGTLKDVQGEMNTMMGAMPIPVPQGEQATATIALTPRGPDISEIDNTIPDVLAGGFAEEAMGKGRVALALVLLPGRMVTIGESWTDTIHASPEGQGVKADGVTVMTGTYVRDTTLDNRTLHVLQIRSTIKMTMSGEVQGTPMQQAMEGGTESEVLWDPARRLVVSVDARTDMKMNTAVQGMDLAMTMTSVSRTREIKP